MRITFDEFVKKYRCIAGLECTNDNKENAILIVKKASIPDSEWQTGTTKIFLKQDAVIFYFYFIIMTFKYHYSWHRKNFYNYNY